ncbi:MAG: hypothetical protein CVU84_02100 [Firmicutes bacterium HGW-Firmicutes-1]|jgi:hypothetical protein|nr:MAG: hypothetical protein CVU84_02100 [Firmicutes bacterium HGW-Firmicutes-1]
MYIGILGFGIVGFLFCLFVMYRTNHGIPGIQKYDPKFRLLDMRFRYNSNIVYDTFERIGIEGRKAYENYLLLDFCFITCFLIVMIAITLKVTTDMVIRNLLIAFAISRAIYDVLENTILIILLNRYPNQSNLMAKFCSLATTLKFISLYLWIAGIIIILLISYFK